VAFSLHRGQRGGCWALALPACGCVLSVIDSPESGWLFFPLCFNLHLGPGPAARCSSSIQEAKASRKGGLTGQALVALSLFSLETGRRHRGGKRGLKTSENNLPWLFYLSCPTPCRHLGACIAPQEPTALPGGTEG
jgi:hypothetical protein